MRSNNNILFILFVICIILIIMNAGINGCKESIDVMEIQKFENEIRRIEELYKNMNEIGEINNIQEIQNLLEQINALQSNADLFFRLLEEELEKLLTSKIK